MKPRTTPPNFALNPGAQVASVTLRGQGRTIKPSGHRTLTVWKREKAATQADHK